MRFYINMTVTIGNYVNHYDNVEEPNFEIIDKKETDTSCDFSCY